jgi:predicted RNase H-like HicB family nuclease
MSELVFEVTQEADGGFVAEALDESIFTEADTWEELRANAREAVRAFYFDRLAPDQVRLHLPRDLSGQHLVSTSARGINLR